MLTTKKIETGVFKVLWDGKETECQIINGSRGTTGRDSVNMYGVVMPKRPVKWIGSLSSCKQLLALHFGDKFK